MTKKEIIEELKKYGIEATLRARKSTLEELLKEKQSETATVESRTIVAFLCACVALAAVIAISI